METVKEFKDAAERLQTPLAELNAQTRASAENTEDWMVATKAVEKFIEKIMKNMELTNEEMKKLLELAGKVEKDVKETGVDFGKVGEILKERVKKQLESINERIAKGILGGIKSMSKGLAQVVVLGKDFGQSMKQIAQQIMVNIIAGLIEQIALQTIAKILGKEELETEEKIKHFKISKHRTKKKNIVKCFIRWWWILIWFCKRWSCIKRQSNRGG